MRVLFAYRYGILGGVCTQLINRLSVVDKEKSVEAHLLFSEDFGISETLREYPHLYFENRPGSIRDLVRHHRFDVAVVIDTPEIIQALAPIVDLPIVTEVHTTLPQGLRYLNNRSWTTAGFIVPSNYLRHRLRRGFGVGLSEPVEICPNSINPDLFPIVDLEEPPSRPVVCWVGKLDGHKNWRGFIQAADQIKTRNPRAVFWMIGGVTAPAAEETCLLREIAALGLSERLRWMPRIEYRAMHRVYAAVRMSGGVKLVTSVDESFGMSVLEALICGCPVVAPRVGGLPEISTDGPSLQFYTPGRQTEAAQSVLEIIDSESAHKIALTGRADLIQRFGTEAVVSDYFDVLKALMAGSPPSAPNHEQLLSAVDRLGRRLPRPDPTDMNALDTLEATARVLSARPVRLYLKLRSRVTSNWPHRDRRPGADSGGG